MAMASPPPGLFSAISYVLLLLTAASATSPDIHEVFSYSGAKGPDNWGHISPEFSACSSGTHQSPVNIVTNQTVVNMGLSPLIRGYRPANATLVNNGFNVGIFFNQDAGFVGIEGKNYSLKQMHWHTPSEHQINGIQYPAELQLFHQAEDGGIAVIAVLYNYDKPDRFIGTIEGKLGEQGKETCGEDQESHIALGVMDPKNIKRHTRRYYRYLGSTTTPPCTEQVIWNIHGKVRKISKEQVEALRAPLFNDCKNNFRPLQSLNGRKIELYDEHNDAP
ncbi:hypothetical protein SAY87_018727 [Trapa incisa]|uniref:Alpha-carbonic anhydrase domain-containing protein n=1 Tax=Trapa incisa TaxID=236973 RepID=A0AAN7Q0R7_9MYRT|nr:hypothetical protein SAY87_018727 [Trapa incisa]